MTLPRNSPGWRNQMADNSNADKKLPRGHAYARFRTEGYSIHFDFPEKAVPWIGELIKLAAEKFAKDEEEYPR